MHPCYVVHIAYVTICLITHIYVSIASAAGLNLGIMMGNLVGGLVLQAVRLRLLSSYQLRPGLCAHRCLHVLRTHLWVAGRRLHRPSFHSGHQLHRRVAHHGAVNARAPGQDLEKVHSHRYHVCKLLGSRLESPAV